MASAHKPRRKSNWTGPAFSVLKLTWNNKAVALISETYLPESFLRFLLELKFFGGGQTEFAYAPLWIVLGEVSDEQRSWFSFVVDGQCSRSLFYRRSERSRYDVVLLF
jgi:hypothetical protein